MLHRRFQDGGGGASSRMASISSYFRRLLFPRVGLIVRAAVAATLASRGSTAESLFKEIQAIPLAGRLEFVSSTSFECGAPCWRGRSVGSVVGTGSPVKNALRHRKPAAVVGLLEPAVAFVLCCCMRLDDNVKIQ